MGIICQGEGRRRDRKPALLMSPLGGGDQKLHGQVRVQVSNASTFEIGEKIVTDFQVVLVRAKRLLFMRSREGW